MSVMKSIEAATSDIPQQRVLYRNFYKWYDGLPEDEREALDEALSSAEVSTRRLFESLKIHEKVTFGENALYYHRRTLTQEK